MIQKYYTPCPTITKLQRKILGRYNKLHYYSGLINLPRFRYVACMIKICLVLRHIPKCYEYSVPFNPFQLL